MKLHIDHKKKEVHLSSGPTTDGWLFIVFLFFPFVAGTGLLINEVLGGSAKGTIDSDTWHLFLGGLGAAFVGIVVYLRYRRRALLRARGDIQIQRGLRRWSLPADRVQSAQVSYAVSKGRGGAGTSHLLEIDLTLDLPDDPRRKIEGGVCSVFEIEREEWDEKMVAIHESLNEALHVLGWPETPSEEDENETSG